MQTIFTTIQNVCQMQYWAIFETESETEFRYSGSERMDR